MSSVSASSHTENEAARQLAIKIALQREVADRLADSLATLRVENEALAEKVGELSASTDVSEAEREQLSKDLDELRASSAPHGDREKRRPTAAIDREATRRLERAMGERGWTASGTGAWTRPPRRGGRREVAESVDWEVAARRAFE